MHLTDDVPFSSSGPPVMTPDRGGCQTPRRSRGARWPRAYSRPRGSRDLQLHEDRADLESLESPDGQKDLGDLESLDSIEDLGNLESGGLEIVEE